MGYSKSKDLKQKSNLKSLPLLNSNSNISNSKNPNLKGSIRIINNAKFNKLNLTNNFDGENAIFFSPKKPQKLMKNAEQHENDRYFQETHESGLAFKDASLKAKKISFDFENKNSPAILNLNANNGNFAGEQQNALLSDCNSNNNQPQTTKSNLSQIKSNVVNASPKNDDFVNFNPNSILNFIKKTNENKENNGNENNNNNNNISNNEVMQSTHYKSGFNSTINFNANMTNNLTSSIFRSTQLNLVSSIAAVAAAQSNNESITNTTDSDLASNRSFYNHINNISNANRKNSKSELKGELKAFVKNNNYNYNNNNADPNANNLGNLPNQNQSQRKTLRLSSQVSLNNLNHLGSSAAALAAERNYTNTNTNSNSNNNLNKITEVSSPSRHNSISNRQVLTRNNATIMNQKNSQTSNNNKNINININTNTNNLNSMSFNKTFHSNSIRSLSNNINNNKNNTKNSLNNSNNKSNNNNTNFDFFSTQVFDFKSSAAARKRLLPHLIQGFKSIENQMTDIKSNLSKAIKDLDGSIENGEKHKSKNNREFASETENTNDVFLYGNNGEGYYMSNQKIMKEASILKSMKSENIFKHKRFFRTRFNLDDTSKETFIENGLSRGTETKFKKIEEYLDETEDMKKRAIKHIELHQMKVRMEALNENSVEDIEGDDFSDDVLKVE